MAANTTLIGNATSDVELRYTHNGRAVGSLTIAVNERKRNDDGTYSDGDTWFARCTLWGELAENAAASIHKGARVVAHGRIGQRDWEDKQGQKRTSVEVTVDALGPDLRYATAQVTRTGRGEGAGRSQAAQNAPADPWGQAATNAAQNAAQGSWGADDDQIPF